MQTVNVTFIRNIFSFLLLFCWSIAVWLLATTFAEDIDLTWLKDVAMKALAE